MKEIFIIEIDDYFFKVSYTPGYNTSLTYDYGDEEDFIKILKVIDTEGNKMDFQDLDFDEYYELVLDETRDKFNEEHEVGLFKEDDEDDDEMTEWEYKFHGPHEDKD